MARVYYCVFNRRLGQGSYYYPILIQFLIFFPIIYIIIKKFGSKGLIICFLLNLFWEVIKIPLMITESFYRLNFFRYIFVISFGCYSALYGANNKNVTIVSIIGAVFGIVFLAVTQYTGYKAVIITYWQTTSLFAVMTVIPLFNLLVLKVKKVSKIFLPLTYMGKASYHIFFAQMALTSVIPSIVKPRFLALAVSLVVCIVAGIVFYLAETPLNKKITKSLYKRIDKKQLKHSV